MNSLSFGVEAPDSLPCFLWHRMNFVKIPRIFLLSNFIYCDAMRCEVKLEAWEVTIKRSRPNGIDFVKNNFPYARNTFLLTF